MLIATNLKKSYGNRIVIKDVSFQIQRGEVFGILGPNGAGKTTSFYMIFGIVKPDSGKITLDGHDITNIPMHMKSRIGIGYLPQEASIFQTLTTKENILCVLENFYHNKDERMTRLDQLIYDFELQKVANSPSIALSGGERRRLEIARLLASDPSFVLLDEPFAGVDPVSVNGVINIIKDLAKRNIGVVITDHNAREILKSSDKISVIYDGKVLVHGTKDDILQNQTVKDVYLGKDFVM
ncbi:LPS export ABC transporter ATP-binding protein [Candidatus Deianiraea vastatrix]|uniref:Lipopolysaccharide export system ATP-binding protein LptB n=1 Tax=Candidatus Deianiraea vastatrix TaxID=2163644 RepID=A0A5B8XHJ8_9RICK|nr:LPS export ABC transporter ATP-binding protein [Candidatus Deianiraea vastatrix]QED23604.1 Putative lipopolysaccharide export system ATP-binding protein LptB [Candidatus Deianiraea vastatrix]